MRVKMNGFRTISERLLKHFHEMVRQVRHQEAGGPQSFWDRTAGMSCSPHLACIAWSLGHFVRDVF